MSTGIPRPLSTTVTLLSSCTVTLISSAKFAIASSTELSTTSQTRWCSPISPVEPMYIAGRLRTASIPPKTLMEVASYLCPAAFPPVVSFSAMGRASPQMIKRACSQTREGGRADLPTLALPIGLVHSKNRRNFRPILRWRLVAPVRLEGLRPHPVPFRKFGGTRRSFSFSPAEGGHRATLSHALPGAEAQKRGYF